MLHQSLSIRAVTRISNDTDTRRDMQFMVIDLVWTTQSFEYLVCAHCRVLRLGHLREQDHKFITALTADRVRGAHTSEQPACNRL